MTTDKVFPGDPIEPRAALWNSFIDTAAKVRAHALPNLGGQSFPTGSRSDLIRYVSSNDVLRWQAIGLGSPAIPPVAADSIGFESGVLLNAAVPSGSSPFGIAQTETTPRIVGTAAVTGATICVVGATVLAGDTVGPDVAGVLQPVQNGWARILWAHPIITEPRFAVCLFEKGHCQERLERFVMRSGWYADKTAWAEFTYPSDSVSHAIALLRDPDGIFIDQIAYGGVGWSIEDCSGNHWAIQARCNQPPVTAPQGSCVWGSPGNSSCQVMDAVACNALGGVWNQGAACP